MIVHGRMSLRLRRRALVASPDSAESRWSFRMSLMGLRAFTYPERTKKIPTQGNPSAKVRIIGQCQNVTAASGEGVNTRSGLKDMERWLATTNMDAIPLNP